MSSLKRVFKWIGISFGLLVVIALVINAILVWRSGSQLRAQYAKIRAAGDPVFLSDLAEHDVSPEQNAYTCVRQAIDDLRPAGKELSDVMSLEGFETGDLSKEDLQRIEALVAAHPAVVPLLEKASQCPRYVLPVDYSLPSQEFLEQYLTSSAQDVRSPMRFLYARAVWLHAKGDGQGSLEQCLLMLRLARRVDQQPLLVGGLVAVACRGYPLRVAAQVLQSQPISDPMRQSLEAELGKQDLFAACRWAFKSERAYGVSAQDIIPARKNWLVRAYWDRGELLSLRLMDQLTAATGQPWNRLQAIYRQATADASGSLLLALAIPAQQAGHQAYYRTEAMIRCLRVLNALQRHAMPENDSVPALSELGLPPEATLDPFTGKPLSVKRLPEGWLIYSFGPDGDDDGGKLTDDGQNDIGIGPPEKGADD